MSSFKKKILILVVLVALVAIAAGIMTSCKPPQDTHANPYPIVDNEANQKNLDKTTKDEAVERATGSLDNLLQYLDSEVVSTTGYYVGTKMHINTEDGSAFILNLQANMYTWPYEQYEEGTPEREEALAKHNELIKYNDLLLEWYDGTTNTMLIGFYYDGINPDPADPGNVLYLNLQGAKRYFLNFGDTVFYQQLIRLITQLSLDKIIASTSSDGSDGAISSMTTLLKQAVTTNYKLTLNGDVTSVYFNDIPLSLIAGDVTKFIQKIFSPFEDKIDPLTYKYLGFLFSTLGTAEIRTLNSDMRFLMKPNEVLGKEILTGLDVDFRGSSLVKKKNKNGTYSSENVPFTMNIAVDYDIRVSQNIVLDRENYTLYETGNYEFVGDMYIPPLDLKLDVLLRTDVNKHDNKTNKVYMACRDLATDELIIGAFYKNELTYIDIEGLQHLYGGVKFEDIGLPKAYKGGFNLASTLAWLSDFIDTMIVLLVDSILSPKNQEANDKYNEVMTAIMQNIESTMKDEDDPASHATIKVRVDMPLIKRVMSVTSKTNTNFTTDQIIQLLNRQFNMDLEAIASILGMSVNELLDRTYFNITYDVDTYNIKIEVYSAAEKPKGSPADLYLRLDLMPTKIGQKVRIAFPNFDQFKELEDVMTYSGYIEGQFIFAQTEEVDLSKALGAFMGDTSGLNTPFILPKAADIYFTMTYDQYIREQILENGRWTRKGRSAFNIYAYMVEGDVSTPVLRIYANDVSFNTAYPLEELGYVWLDYLIFDHLPKFKIREDLFVTSLYEYMGYDFENESGDIVLGLTDIIKALMKDSWATFEPEVIRVTTSNDTIKQFFGVDEMIGSLSIMVGFKQRVKNIDQLEKDFAMYSVGTFENIVGESPYSIKLHDTVPVYFDFGQRIETRNLKFLYNKDSISVISGNAYYRPRIDKQFMGATRDYLVYVNNLIGRQGVRELVENYYEWEPLAEVPSTVGAYYGETQNVVNNYLADYNLHAIFDKETRYYTVISEFGYETVYDFDNNLYVLGLGSEYKSEKGFKELGEGATVFNREFQSGPLSLKHVYDLGLRLPGYYILQNTAGLNILYNYKAGHYIVRRADYALMETVEIEGEMVTRRVIEGLIGTGAIVRQYEATYHGKEMIYDLVTGMYMVKVQGRMNNTDVTFRLHYNPITNNYVVPSYLENHIPAVAQAVGSARIVVDSTINFEQHPYSKINWEGTLIDEVNWNTDLYDGLEYKKMTWDDITLAGGKYIVKVVIGEGMMATYRENVIVKVLNRNVLTDLPFININTSNGPVQAPIAMTLDVDPIVYLLYKAFFINGLRNDPDLFVRWYFEKHDVTIQFTKIYPLTPEEETPDALGGFIWHFDHIDENTIYSEKQINNYGSLTENSYTYVYTNFHGQIIALRLRVLPRILSHFMAPGETDANTHTIDALYPSSYRIPTNLTFYYEGLGGQEYSLNMQDFMGSTLFANLPARLPMISSILNGPNAKPLINWTHPIADNVKLVNDRDADGNPFPFIYGVNNKTTSFLDYSINFDFDRNWYYEDWFKIPELVINVNIPDKVIGEFNRNLITEGHTERTYSLQNIKISKYIAENEVFNVNDELLGIYNVDPFDSSTWTLPTNISVFFTIDEANGVYQKYEYNVTWQNQEGDTNLRFNVDADGVYHLVGVNEDPSAYYLEATIGDPNINYITVRLLVRNLSATASDVAFYNADGSSLKNAAGIELPVTSIAGGHLNSLQERLFTYSVDTYDRFDIPRLLTVTFKDASVRTYPVSWSENQPWVQGTDHDLYATLGSDSAFKQRIYLNYQIAFRDINDIEIVRRNDAYSLVVNVADRTINVTGVRVDTLGYVIDSDNAYITVNESRVNIYDYFMYLFGEIRGTFAQPINPTIVMINDAATSAELPLFGTIDLQKMIRTLGQGVSIYIGQGKGADDFLVTVTIVDITPTTELDIDEDKDSYILSHAGSTTGVALEAYNPDNTPKYPNGYVIASNFGFTVKYKDGRVVNYSNSMEGALPVPVWWSVVSSPLPGVDPASEWMIGVKEFDKIDRITEESIYGGGVLWLSTLLSDGSRVYCRFSSSGINIGSNYDSEAGSGRYRIEQGLLTIHNLYDNYSLGTNIIPSRLPSSLVLEGNFVISGVIWTMAVTSEVLDAINYQGTSTDIVIATARVMRETVELRLRVLPCEVMSVSYIDSNTQSRTLVSENRDDDGNIVLNFDAYANWAYAGTLLLPRVLHLNYFTTGDKREYAYPSIEYMAQGTTSIRLNSVPYKLTGHTLTSNGLDADVRNIRFRITLVDGQIINLILHFNNKTVTGYKFDNIEESVNKQITINPYSEHVTLSQSVVLKFQEGPDLTYTTEWEMPSDYEVRYDTYETILKLKPEGERYFMAYSKITGFANLEDQNMNLKIGVLDYIIDQWSLEAGVTDYYNVTEDAHNPNPNATYHMHDPYAEKTTDLPSSVEDIKYHAGQVEHRLKIVWDFTDADIVAAGTPSGHILVRGWIYDRDRGQPVTLKLFIDTWSFDTIRRLQGGVYQSMMQDIRFYFSQVSGVSSYSTYQVAFQVKNVRSSADPVPRNIIFIPEDIDPTTVKIAGTNDYYPANYAYRISWDQGALVRARNAMSTGGDAVGSFSLSNAGAEIVRTTPTHDVYYQYETLNVTQVDLGYGFGTQNEAIYVVDPLNPYFGNNYVLPIRAKGNYNLESNINLNDKGMVVSAVWWTTGQPTISIPDKFVGGGVHKGWAVTVRVENPQTGFRYQEVFRIMMVFLDMAPITYINNSSMSVLNRGAIKTKYNESTYAGTINPYEDAYRTSLMTTKVNRNGVIDNVMNTAISDYNLGGTTLDYSVVEWDPNILITNNMHIQYSRKVSIRGRTYTSGIVRRQYSTRYEITGLDLSYGMGMDSAKYDLIADDPLAVAGKQKTKFIVNPLSISFAHSGSAVAGDNYTFIIPESRITGNFDGSPFAPDMFTYRITWWNPQVSGALKFNSDIAIGGYIDHWKVVISILREGVVEYTEVYNIILFFLDGRPTPAMEIATSGQNIVINSPKQAYGENDYGGYSNPYGEYYTAELRSEMAALANVVHAGQNYMYEVTEWNEQAVVGGYTVQTAKVIRIYKTSLSPDDPRTIYSHTPFITRRYVAP